MFVTLETEGSHFIKTDYPLDFISLSPKFSNSIPELGIKTPLEKTVDDIVYSDFKENEKQFVSRFKSNIVACY